MEAQTLLRQFLFTFITFLYINGDSDISINNGIPFPSFFPPRTPLKGNIFVTKPGLRYNFSKQWRNLWPYFQGQKFNGNVVIPPMVPRLVPGGGYVGPGLNTNIPLSHVMPSMVPGVVGPIAQGPVLVPTPIQVKGPRIPTIPHKQTLLPHHVNFAQGGQWKGIPPVHPGMINILNHTPFSRTSYYGYGPKAIKQTQMFSGYPWPKPSLMPSMSLPIPGQMPQKLRLKQAHLLADPVHGLPLNHLYAHIPMAPPVMPVGIGVPVPTIINPLVADIILVIDASPEFGHIDKRGVVIWNPRIVDFLTDFINKVPLGPEGNRIGIVIVSIGIDDLIPLTHDQAFLVKSLNNLRPTFSGGCSGNGIGTATNLFFQYGRRTAVKRIILITDDSPFCAMLDSKNARYCGIDIVNIVFGGSIPPAVDHGIVQSKWALPGSMDMTVIWEPLMKRMVIPPVHGGWSMWSGWNHCSMAKTCGIGYQQRFRVCDNPKPMYGGVRCPGVPAEARMCYPNVCLDITIGHWTAWTGWTACSTPCGIGSKIRSRNCVTLTGHQSPTCRGKYVEMKECLVKACPQHGGWSLWSDWGLCSVSCGVGSKMRARQCNNPVPKFGGNPCKGDPVEEMPCQTESHCPIPGGFSTWTVFGQCSALCGIGERVRTRNCDNPIPQHGGPHCKGMLIQAEACDSGINCPIDGGWSLWGEFTMCDVPCGVGIKRRERFCHSPVPQFGGAMCKGPSFEEAACDTGKKCAIDGNWGPWSDYSQCSALCGSGTKRKTRVCDNPLPMHGGKDCIGPSFHEMKCKAGVPCAIDGGWGMWSAWPLCLVTCGSEIITRSRKCNSPAPQYGGAVCVGLGVEEKVCDTKVSCPVHGHWSEWTLWSVCSEPCGLGKKTRHRLCNNPSPKHGGASCEGEMLQEKICDTNIPCPIHGGWSIWTVIESCNVECGTGSGKRIRECINPLPQFGGHDCIGPNIELFECNTGKACPIHGGWSLWGVWTKCTIGCGVGKVIRKRACVEPMPQFGGFPCDGPDIEERPCDSGILCPVDGHWSLWAAWTLCPITCGEGVSMRKRHCDSPAPLHGGLPCDGPAEEQKPCGPGLPCPIDGGWSPWGVPSACSVSCGTGFMIQTRLCDSPPPQFGGLLCKGIDTQEVVCDTNVFCPIHGIWGPWSEYSLCSGSCGIGSMTRTRLCDTPAPEYGGKKCVGDLIDKQPCEVGIPCPIHGVWSPWSAFTPCSKTCGVGIQRRMRRCNKPPPAFGGLDCPGFADEDRTCNTGIDCVIDGGWSYWSNWGKCSAVCGVGFQQRKRFCDNPRPMYGGGDCFGTPMEDRKCDTGSFCPIDGGWGNWSEYSICSVTCGAGFKTRVRLCDSPMPKYGGLDCKGPLKEEIPCDMGINCPVHGHWTSWQPWGPCSVVCGIGNAKRFRECSNPPPLYGGHDCTGDAFEKMICDTGIHCPIPGSWGPWSGFIPCSATCGIGTTQRTRLCDSPLPMYGGEPCIGIDIDKGECDMKIPCPIHGGFSLWTKWSLCSAKCGKGIRTRNRLCNNPEPMFGGADCLGELIQEEVCMADVHCPIDGFWSLWSPWSECSAPCGKGQMERGRFCNSPAPMYGGKPCIGKKIEISPCITGKPCPVDGGWSLWTVWTKCSVPCGEGHQQRKRLCTNPLPQHGGHHCKGIDVQEQLCATGIHCPQDGNWGLWSEWGKCKALCGKGVYTRSRSCNNPPALHGGHPCAGPDVEDMPCETGIPCPIHGNWGPWENWSLCSVTCGVGVKRKIRTCSNPAPMFGGEQCVEEFELFKDCDTGVFCPIDGNWSPWGKPSPCSVSCGMGFHIRKRECASPVPQYGGLFCVGPDTEKSPCDRGIMCPIHGNWSPWSRFGDCLATCGYGIQTRTRTCSNPSPQFGGDLCYGKYTEDRPCDSLIPCAIDGGWTFWSDWSVCSETCGFGFKIKKRSCTSPVPAHGGLMCKGFAEEKMKCDSGVPCPVDGQWGGWMKWSLCSVDCGVGIKERRRECNNPVPVFGGHKCHGKDFEQAECDTHIHCPIDGHWTVWSDWSMCSFSCGVGTKTRTRFCTAPPPQFGGLECVGQHKDIIDCDTGIHCAVDGQWSLWTEWGACSVKCGKGSYTRTRMCNSPAPLYGGVDCLGPSFENGVCDTLIACPVHGGWSYWSEWSACSAKCGYGEQIRTRVCNNPNPLYGGLQCKGISKEAIGCKALVNCPVDGNWGPWSGLSLCSRTCGVGFQQRIRICDSPPPQHGGIPCKGMDREKVQCETNTKCPIHGGWTLWSKWSVCVGICGEGIRERRRACTNPVPQFGGGICPGSDLETMKCKTKMPCSIHGNWGSWIKWSKCTGPCGMGVTTRVRYCDSPKPQYGGLDCFGISEEALECDTGVKCPIDGAWSKWTKWSACMAKCGLGSKRRIRECVNPVPKFGGKPCKGHVEEILDCDSKIPCAIDGNWSPWSKYSPCSASCEFGLQTRKRFCNDPLPQFGGRVCKGPAENTITCEAGVVCPIDGNWGPWYEWSLCSVTCGIGQRERRRECNNPPPSLGGIKCDGLDYELSKCDTQIICPIHGHWTEWSMWEMCSAVCGLGFKTRERICSNPEPMYGGEPCFGGSKEKIDCDSGKHCAIDGNWGEWSQFSKCAGECGKGTMIRERVCSSPAPQYGGHPCIGNNVDKMECDTLIPCAIHGGWSYWGAWSTCSETCRFGVQTRKRTCTNPSPLYGGMMCVGPVKETRKCTTGMECPVHGLWSIWLEWSACDAKCGVGIMKRMRECSSPRPAFGGLPCDGPKHEIMDCKAAKPCPIAGNWSPWSMFDKCSETCGVGYKRRRRFCDNPEPMFGGAICTGPGEETVKCDTGFPCPVNGGWSSWFINGSCSVTCGSGYLHKERKCNSPLPQFGGTDCFGPNFEEIPCKTGIICPIDGGLSFWGAWSKCLGNCGIGAQKRTRLCTNPSPQYGGNDCVGLLEEFKDCDIGVPCPVDGRWSLWSKWGKCDATCGIGKQRRLRTCTRPPPQFGGLPCNGISEEWRECKSVIPCAVDGGWSVWSIWSKCSVSCGDGVQVRLRYCNNPSPIFGGRNCKGVAEETIPCSAKSKCEWSLWNKWTACSSTCGVGIRERSRFCNNPPGIPCLGPDTEQIPCKDNPPCPHVSAWAEWSKWSKCDCVTGMQTRIRICKGLSGCIGKPRMDRKCDPIDLMNNCPKQEWQLWSFWSACHGSCGEGVRERTRECVYSKVGGIATGCIGLHTEVAPCQLKPCLPAEWEPWSPWSPCSHSCGQGIRERTRLCLDTVTGLERLDCIGLNTEILTCEDLPCPTRELNCSTECKWDNGIGYAVYPGDCSMFVQCDSIHGQPLVQQCPWGLLWSIDMLQCTYPHMSECDKCAKIKPGEKRSYYITCRSYWTCAKGVPEPHCCAQGFRFDHLHKECVMDVNGECNDPCPPVVKKYVSKCTFKASGLGPTWYEQMVGKKWTPMPCAKGTVFSQKTCQCVYLGTDGQIPARPDCLPELHLNFNTLKEDRERNVGIHIENVNYLGDGTALFDGTGSINSNIFSNAEWGRNVYVYIRFKPEGTGRHQGLVHNSGCGPSDIGPSVFIGMDRVADGIDMKFSAVPQGPDLKYDFVNITTPDHKMIDAWFKFGGNQFMAEVNGITAVLDIPGICNLERNAAAISRRHGTLNIGGNLCKIGNESFHGFKGILDEVRIYKCKPPI